jgi:hypothetical protein
MMGIDNGFRKEQHANMTKGAGPSHDACAQKRIVVSYALLSWFSAKVSMSFKCFAVPRANEGGFHTLGNITEAL